MVDGRIIRVLGFASVLLGLGGFWPRQIAAHEIGPILTAAEQSELAGIVQEIQSRPPALVVLDEVIRALPEGAYLDYFGIYDDMVSLSVDADIESFKNALEASPRFGQVRFPRIYQNLVRFEATVLRVAPKVAAFPEHSTVETVTPRQVDHHSHGPTTYLVSPLEAPGLLRSPSAQWRHVQPHPW